MSIKMGSFDAALVDLGYNTDAALTSEKALWRTFEALYSLRRYSEAKNSAQVLCEMYPGSPLHETALSKVTSRVQEQTTGVFPFSQFYEDAANLRPVDHATYVGPVAIRPSSLGGRGLFTTKAVKAGDLLLCEKAFAHARADPESADPSRSITILISSQADKVSLGMQSELMRVVMQKIHRNPSLASIVTSLDHGSYEPVAATEVDGTPIVDL